MLVGLPNAIARGVFAMNREYAEAYLPLVINLFEGKPVTAAPGKNIEGAIKPFAKDPNTGKEYSVFVMTEWGPVYKGFADAPKGSIAIIPITDVIMKYDFCGQFGTQTITNIIKDAEASQNVVGILLDMDTPGGEVYGTKNVSDAVANCKKPVVVHVNDGYCASAGYYIACGADRILMNQPATKVGSIGVYTTLMDFTGMYESKGVKVLTIYSPTSPEKNAAYLQAVKEGKTQLMEKELAYLDAVFMDQVRKGRGSKLNEKALAGGMYFTEEAISLGLCDGQATQEEAIDMIINLSGSSQTFSLK